jgi:hypothetical protein
VAKVNESRRGPRPKTTSARVCVCKHIAICSQANTNEQNAITANRLCSFPRHRPLDAEANKPHQLINMSTHLYIYLPTNQNQTKNSIIIMFVRFGTSSRHQKQMLACTVLHTAGHSTSFLLLHRATINSFRGFIPRTTVRCGGIGRPLTPTALAFRTRADVGHYSIPAASNHPAAFRS